MDFMNFQLYELYNFFIVLHFFILGKKTAL